MDPKFHISYLNLAMVDLMENNVSAALEKFLSPNQLPINAPTYFFIKGTCFIQKNDIESAIRTIQQSLKLYSNDGIFLLNSWRLILSTTPNRNGHQLLEKNPNKTRKLAIGNNNDIDTTILIK